MILNLTGTCDMAKIGVSTKYILREEDGIPYMPEEIPRETLDEMLQAEADVVEPEIVKNANTLLRGPYWTGTTAKAVKRKRPVYARDSQGGRVRELLVTFAGVREDEHHRKTTKESDRRNAAIAFINEYGNKKTEARAFMAKAVDEKEAEAQDAGEAVFDKWLNKNM